MNVACMSTNMNGVGMTEREAIMTSRFLAYMLERMLPLFLLK